ncbi:hypothetical protein AAK27_360 [Mycoplasma capricolum subsp. capricolum]|nr:hypothetical protein AAK27_360 [Mycoplasma capricolum subsp. capricolum]
MCWFFCFIFFITNIETINRIAKQIDINIRPIAQFLEILSCKRIAKK